VSESPANGPDPAAGRLAELRASARGWHGVQLAVLGFIGLCGVLKPGGDAQPRWLEVLAGILILGALVLACLGTYLVGRAAWPLYGARRAAPVADDPAEIARASRQVTSGLAATFGAVALLALAGLSSWWPAQGGAASAAEVQVGGTTVCGRIVGAGPGELGLATASQGTLRIPVDTVTAIRAVGRCG
jgi:hypothetical protein